MVTMPSASEQSSCIITVSNPVGICAPVNIRIASPRLAECPSGCPAAARPPIGSFVGVEELMSSKNTAYPSTAEFAYGGTSTCDAISSASVRPIAARSGTVVILVTGRICLDRIVNASDDVISRSAPEKQSLLSCAISSHLAQAAMRCNKHGDS